MARVNLFSTLGLFALETQHTRVGFESEIEDPVVVGLGLRQTNVD